MGSHGVTWGRVGPRAAACDTRHRTSCDCRLFLFRFFFFFSCKRRPPLLAFDFKRLRLDQQPLSLRLLQCIICLFQLALCLLNPPCLIRMDPPPRIARTIQDFEANEGGQAKGPGQAKTAAETDQDEEHFVEFLAQGGHHAAAVSAISIVSALRVAHAVSGIGPSLEVLPEIPRATRVVAYRPDFGLFVVSVHAHGRCQEAENQAGDITKRAVAAAKPRRVLHQLSVVAVV